MSNGGDAPTIKIPLSRGVVEVLWESRQELLTQIRHLEAPTAAFMPVPAASLISLTRNDKVLLLQAIDAWAKTAGSPAELPADMWELRNALFDDLVDRPLQ